MNLRIVSVLCFALAFGSFGRAQHAYTQLREFGFSARAASQPLSGLSQGSGGWLYGASRGGYGAIIYRVKNDGTGFSILHDFGGTNFPSRGALVVGSDGAVYGTMILANAVDGAVYRIQQDGSGFQTYPLPIQAQIISGVIEGSDGRLYGTTFGGGENDAGTVFGINKNGTGFALAHDFSFGDGYQPAAEPLEGSDGALYLPTRLGGNANAGVVCRMGKNGSGFSILHHFPAAGTNDGRIPNCRLAPGPGGYLYGTTEAGGVSGEDDLFSGAGVVFRLTMDGDVYSVVRRFEGSVSDGVKPRNVLVGLDGNLYGTSQNASYAHNVDGIFRMTATGDAFVFTFTWVSADNESVQLNPMFQSADGTFYGTSAAGGASGVGQAFKARPNGTQFQGLHDFSATGADGSNPATLLRDADGTLYGTTLGGGSSDSGTIYKLETNGAYQILHDFVAPGGFPQGLVLASDGFLYGSSYFGKNLFRLSKDGLDYAVTVDLFGAPIGPLIEASDFLLYGATEDGGTNSRGSLFRVNADGTDLQTIHSFTGTSNVFVAPSGILEGTDGKLYGTALRGGTNNQGMVFKLNKDGSQYQEIHSFVAPAGVSVSPNPLLEGSDGILYGTTRLGGDNGQGSIYRISKAGTYELLHSFASDKGRPAGRLAAGPNGWLYGVTEDSGTFDGGLLFRFKAGPTPTVYVLYNFGNGTLGRNPAAGVVTSLDGEAYGTTAFGGFSSGFGTIYRVDLRPILAIQRAGTASVELSWPWNGENYNLLVSTGLELPFGPLSVNTTNIADRVTATVPLQPGNRFYLLRKSP